MPKLYSTDAIRERNQRKLELFARNYSKNTFSKQDLANLDSKMAELAKSAENYRKFAEKTAKIDSYPLPVASRSATERYANSTVSIDPNKAFRRKKGVNRSIFDDLLTLDQIKERLIDRQD